jgi:cytochrome c6
MMISPTNEKVLDNVYEENILRILRLILLLAIAILQLTLIDPAQAMETSNGRTIFKNNCASCHIGGGNILVEQKTLKKAALIQYLNNFTLDPIAAIVEQVKNGKNAMPAFKEKLSNEDIWEVSAYIFREAERGW